MREAIPHKSHAGWKAPGNRPDPIDVLESSNQGRIQELIPVRYGPHAAVGVHLLPWRRRGNVMGSIQYTDVQDTCSGMRRLPHAQFRCVWNA